MINKLIHNFPMKVFIQKRLADYKIGANPFLISSHEWALEYFLRPQIWKA